MPPDYPDLIDLSTVSDPPEEQPEDAAPFPKEDQKDDPFEGKRTGRPKSLAVKARAYDDECLKVLVKIMRKKETKDNDKKDCAIAILQYGHGRPGSREPVKTTAKPKINIA